jgi:hypothetical protein
MRLPLLTAITRKINGGHYTTDARTEDGQLVFGFRGWLVEAGLKFDLGRFCIGVYADREDPYAATKHVDVNIVPFLTISLDLTDFR